MRTLVYEDSKSIVIDSFKLNKLPFRPLNPPFFNYAKSIIKYALETNDSISVYIEDLGDKLYIKIELLEDKPLEFFGKPYSVENPYKLEREISNYEVWINTTTNLPCKIRRERTHDISVRTCTNVELNKLRIEDFKASDYFQSGYSIEVYRMGPGPGKINIEGTTAPEWTLKDADNNIFALRDLKSKVVLIQFTSVSCGPCMASIPFLKELVTEYDPEDFNLIAIEAFAKNSNVLKSYQRRKDFKYPFLMSNKELNKLYQIRAVPVFFVLDENRTIRKVIRGYASSVDKQIRNAINELI
jgi:thiol-disulfide isomerase/thioredoxin